MNQSTISTSTTSTTTTASSAPPPTKQGFRFHKSGSVSPIPPSSVVHQPSQQQLALHTTYSHSTTTESSNSSTRGSGGGGSGIEIQTLLPTGIDHKLYQIVKRIVVATPSLLISSSSSGK